MSDELQVRGARTHNLRGIDVDLPRHRLTAVTGVSGSGKSSFAFDTVFREGERRYLSALSSSARLLAGKLERPQIESVRGLGPAVAVGQRGLTPNVRSTVGTVTGLWDLLRLLLSRLGQPRLTRSQLSFNDEAGRCPDCLGLGVVDQVDPALLVADPTKTLRGGALVPTLKNGYTVYSQVTVEVMNEVCQAHGFDVDTPWQDLSEVQHQVIFFGSQKLRVPFGKHSLESRMKWSGITAKPRDEGFYKGLVPVLQETLLRNRNDNVLRFVRSVPCEACGGSRLGPEARAVVLAAITPVQLAELPVRGLSAWLDRVETASDVATATLTTVRAGILSRVEPLLRLGLGHLPLGRAAKSLSSGELQRIRLAQQLDDDLSGLTYVLDEPSVDLHPCSREHLQAILRTLVQAGNTVLTVEHDPHLIAGCDHVVDIGPGPGAAGGKLLFSGPPQGLAQLDTPTGRALRARPKPPQRRPTEDHARLWLRGATARNLAGDDVPFLLGALNVVLGVSGAGKTTLVAQVLAPAIERSLGRSTAAPGAHRCVDNAESIQQVIRLDQRPLGRTPRSNPATYTKLFDVIREAFAATETARNLGFKATRFSFNTAGGRCPTCEGAGVIRVGMHALGDVSVTCAECDGQRFDAQTLQVTLDGLNVHQVLDLEVQQAQAHLRDLPDAVRILDALDRVGLGYLPIGQPATDLSGGEAQRVRLATELARPVKGQALYVLDEPTKGLHPEDLGPVLGSFAHLVGLGHTLVVVEHNPAVWRAADWLIELGPGAGDEGGRVLFAGPPHALAAKSGSASARVLADASAPEARIERGGSVEAPVHRLRLFGAHTHNLQHVDLELPVGALTVLAGPSGSGKSSLAFDTLAAEANHRLSARLGAHVRSRVQQLPRPALDRVEGLTPTVALRQRTPSPQPRSTVGTLTEVQDFLRLLFSRVGTPSGRPASSLSFNHEVGACPHCTGLGFELRADPERLLTHPERPVLDGAFAGTKIGRHFTDPDGQHAAVLRAAAARAQLDIRGPFEALPAATVDFLLRGDGQPSLPVTWSFKRGGRAGEHRFDSAWLGLLGLLEDEYARTHLGKGAQLESLMRRETCPVCAGGRLGPRALQLKVAGLHLAQVSLRPISTLSPWLESLEQDSAPALQREVLSPLLAELRPRLDALIQLGLGHLHPHRGADTLSAGELMRVHLAAQIAAPMTGVTFVLDEPTRGLHPEDVQGLLRAVRRLTEAGNTVVLVEHSKMACRMADHLVVLGPGSGPQGGRIEYAGPPKGYAWLEAAPAGALPKLTSVRSPQAGRLEIRDAHAHNLQHLDLTLPGQGVTVIAGPSGSGKSTLTHTAIVPAYREAYAQLQVIAQTPLVGGWSSIVATALGVFEPLRALFAKSPEAKAAGLGKSAFAFTTGPGRCPACKGTGGVSVSLDFLPDAHARCEVCGGRRFAQKVLACQVDGRSIADVLDLSVQEALEVFATQAAIRRPLEFMAYLGLSHMVLGRGTPTLSGGEAQRVRLAAHLADPLKARTLFVLDEPSRGLDAAGVLRVQTLVRALAEAGHGVLMVTHDLDLISGADHVVELGPGAGPDGGRVVFEGRPDELRASPSATGRALAAR